MNVKDRRTGNFNVQMMVSKVGSMEEPVYWIPTYDSIYGGGNKEQNEKYSGVR